MKVGEYRNIQNQADAVVDRFQKNLVKDNLRVTQKVWKHMLLCRKDVFLIDGKHVTLVGKSIGAGVYELKLAEGIVRGLK